MIVNLILSIFGSIEANQIQKPIPFLRIILGYLITILTLAAGLFVFFNFNLFSSHTIDFFKDINQNFNSNSRIGKISSQSLFYIIVLDIFHSIVMLFSRKIYYIIKQKELDSSNKEILIPTNIIVFKREEKAYNTIGISQAQGDSDIRTIPYYPIDIEYQDNNGTIKHINHKISINNIPKNIFQSNNIEELKNWLLQQYTEYGITYIMNDKGIIEINESSLEIQYTDESNFKDFLDKIDKDPKLYQQYYGGSKTGNNIAIIIAIILGFVLLMAILGIISG